MAVDMKNFKFAVLMPADSTASSNLGYIQLAFRNSTMFVLETFTATLEDWTTLFSLVDHDHIILISFDEADNWVGIYALLCTQFSTHRQEKNKDAVVKAIHFDVYQAPVVAQVVVQLPAVQPPPPAVLPQPPAVLPPWTLPMDVRPPQVPSMSAPALDPHGQPI
uniref:Uncharacterized protein n=1 Tax=Romanomermis culicivorax TaxID=13658 RepID=A0A915HX49_ROMCU